MELLQCTNLNKSFGTKADDLKVFIGPCICMNCYEVSKELYMQFMESMCADDTV